MLAILGPSEKPYLGKHHCDVTKLCYPVSNSAKHVRLHLLCRTLRESESCLQWGREGETVSWMVSCNGRRTDDSLVQRGGGKREGKLAEVYIHALFPCSENINLRLLAYCVLLLCDINLSLNLTMKGSSLIESIQTLKISPHLRRHLVPLKGGKFGAVWH